MVERLLLAVSWDCLRFVIVVFPDHTNLLFLKSHVLQIGKNNCTQNPYFLRKIDSCILIFEPKNCEVKENSSKAPLNFSPLKCTYLGKKVISI